MTGIRSKNYTFDVRRRNGEWQRQNREAYDRGNGATILLYNREKRTVILTRQFRFPVYINGHDGYLIETAAGLLDNMAPEKRIKAEAEAKLAALDPASPVDQADKRPFLEAVILVSDAIILWARRLSPQGPRSGGPHHRPCAQGRTSEDGRNRGKGSRRTCRQLL